VKFEPKREPMKIKSELMMICLLIFTLPAVASDKTESGKQVKDTVKSALRGKAMDASPQRENVVSRQKSRYRLKNSHEKLSYAFGLQMGETVKGMDAKVDLPSFLLGFKASFNGESPLLSEQKAAKLRDRFYKKRRKRLSRENLGQALNFLKENGARPGVFKTASGLQYEVLREGYGAKPKSSDRVRVQYRGQLIDGTEFDSTYKRGRSIVFPVGKVTKGLSEGLKLMRVGGKSRFYIPPELAYGKRGAGDKIEPNSALIYEVELLAIER